MRGVALDKATAVLRATATYRDETVTDEVAYDLCCAACTLEQWMADEKAHVFMSSAIDGLKIEILLPAMTEDER